MSDDECERDDDIVWGDAVKFEIRTHEFRPPDGGRFRSTSTDSDSNIKRHRAGSISGRLRTASDLEESGLIDKHQKGVLKVDFSLIDLTATHRILSG
jgi:hypothetical protein